MKKKEKPFYTISCKVSIINGIIYYWDNHHGGVKVKTKIIDRR
jgi:hypothetical protein